ncbi:hypothetical protein EGT29_10635 [Pigmentiphaga sp. H8]|uniref:4-hydroxyphenylacetate 3-hydroxylase family protein n=1 Tax=Pigmentiphaga sp. H8 TaxID=2488560 RepID=UPI000F5B25B4|nr:4-hydroxyphenylacetate 3-hydroxylase N-terminal domain-containing protein [Pigmentiphaga sp. H8]AZG08305.1 hypothetical protein EGT29_10635 [Pigmentiphaga sp. H8]
MLKTAKQHLDSLRDGRVVYVGSERIDDVTTHAYFRNAAQTIAGLFDLKRDPAHGRFAVMEENGEAFSSYYLKARSREDLDKRYQTHKLIADASLGMFGRSPDHVSSFVTGMTLAKDVLGPYADNLDRYYEHLRKTDGYATYAVLSPQSSRNPEFYKLRNLTSPSLRVVRETDAGVVISGMKMLATGALFANEIWIGNILPLAPDQAAESITCAVPCNASGLALWARKPMEPNAPNDFEGPLSHRFDESDAMLICDEVLVPWERVFVHNSPDLARQIYVRTAAHAYGNHQSNVRFLSKLQFLVGLASRITQATGADQVPAVKEAIGRLAALEGMLGGTIQGQIHAAEDYPDGGWKCFNRRHVYAALNWCTETYSEIVDKVRELCGGGVFQMPANISVLEDEELAARFAANWDTPQLGHIERMKLFKLAWDIVGSEFAGRHQQYEKFYAGASFIVRNYSYVHADWGQLHGMVDGFMETYGVPGNAAEQPARVGA